MKFNNSFPTTEYELALLLQGHNIPKHTKSFQDYETAKRIVFLNRTIEPALYEKVALWITNYCGV